MQGYCVEEQTQTKCYTFYCIFKTLQERVLLLLQVHIILAGQLRAVSYFMHVSNYIAMFKILTVI